MSDSMNQTKLCVACDVKNCVFHAENDVCNAGKIKVGNGMASKSEDTCCDTFRAK